MDFYFDRLSESEANAIVKEESGQQDVFYDRYGEEKKLDDLLNAENIDFFVSKNREGTLIGFIECIFNNEDILEMGCALIPEFRGEGLGCDFVSSCLEFVQEHYEYEKDVIHTFLKSGDAHSVSIYERVGFVVVDESENWIKLEVNF